MLFRSAEETAIDPRSPIVFVGRFAPTAPMPPPALPFAEWRFRCVVPWRLAAAPFDLNFPAECPAFDFPDFPFLEGDCPVPAAFCAARPPAVAAAVTSDFPAEAVAVVVEAVAVVAVSLG